MHMDKWSPVACLFVALCLLQVGPVVDAVRGVGLGFFLDLPVLLSVFVGLAAVVLWSLANDRMYHRNPWPGRLAWAAAALVLAGVWTVPSVGWSGAALLAGAATWNQVLIGRLSERKRRARELNRRLG